MRGFIATISKRVLRCFLPAIVFAFAGNVFAQAKYNSIADSLGVNLNFKFSKSFDYEPFHFPTSNDTAVYLTSKGLVNTTPTKSNFDQYYLLAEALWQLNKLDSAESMFTAIMACGEEFFEEDYHHASDVPGVVLTYGYGSYSSNYKNKACLGLTRIYIEKKMYEKALEYLQLADKKYLVEYTCGTGSGMYREMIDGLYCACYEGLGMYARLVDFFLNDHPHDWDNDILVGAIKKVYSPAEIKNYLREAENSLVFELDKSQSSTFTTYHYGEPDEETIENKFTSGQATISLFGRKVFVPVPDLPNGKTATKEMFLKEFKNTTLYQSLQ
ncbi:MAG: tetratricopeptide repeat protein [Bacteroidetes bacterium]|nr:tetratricopeptide repeat protein [Bacteroidota bacterium]